MGQQLGAGGGDHGAVAAGVIAMLMGIENLGDLPAPVLGGIEAQLSLQRVDGQGLARFGTGNEIVEVAIGVIGIDFFDDHGPCSSAPCVRYPADPIRGSRFSYGLS